MSADRTKIINNAGFSLVELIIVVSILALAAVPLMKSLAMAGKTNAKAQTIQNATSLGERVMEEAKTLDYVAMEKQDRKDIADGKSADEVTYFKSGVYSYTSTVKSATQGEKFDAKVTISKNTYAGGATVFDESGSSSAKQANVGSANTLKIPKIEDIDTQSQAVLSAKELNKYDTEALNYFNQRLKNYDPSPTLPAAPVVATIKTKTVNIVKDHLRDGNFGVTVKATVTYTDEAGNPYTRDIYAGTFMQQEASDGSKKHFDSNIYIFYTVGVVPGVGKIRETFNIDDSSNVTTFEKYDPTKPMDSHRVYFIRQDKTDTDGPEKITFSGTTEVFTFAAAAAGDLTDGRKKYGDIELVTNLTTTLSDQGYVYKREAKTRVYDITVELYKGSDLITTLNSTVSPGDSI